MGIRGLTQLANGLKYKKKIPLGHISHERHRIWAIDASLFLYRARCLAANSSSETAFGRTHRRPHRFRNVVGDVPLEKSHLVGIIDVVSQLLANCITPVIVFDGPPPQEKARTIQKRKSHKEHAQQNIAWIEQQFESDLPPSNTPTPTKALFANQPGSDEFFERAISQLKSPVGLSSEEKRRIKHELEVEKQKLAAVFLQPHHFYQTQSLCEILGIPFIRSPGEAEVTCVELLRNQKIDAVYTADSDVLVFGCTRMIRRIINDEYVDALDHNFVIQELGINHEQFVCMCILIGCDFCEALPNNKGFTHVLELIKAYTPFDPLEFLASLAEKYPEWSKKAVRAFELYNQRHPHVVHESLISTPCIPSDTALLLQQLKEHLDMDGLYVQRVIDEVTQSFKTYQQTKRPSTATPLGPPVKPGYVPYVKKRPVDFRRFRPEETLVELLLTEESRAARQETSFWSELLSSAHTWCLVHVCPSW